ncbi:4a-hydroxytetrahydrobiopterin dehydratase [Granulicoccus sp. GXG6511]|uniref:4a-hydroxytetrahydrobiopterin dehydratase n=1 Tax=Granulicoccus sp. GXG6511 TaxID=3381351 RepID=UPI003D7F10DC
MSERLKLSDVLAADLADWRMMLNALYATFRTGSFTAGLALVQQITEVAEEANHHPDLTLTYPRVEVKLNSHDVGGVTERDLALAQKISELAAAAGHEAVTDHTVVEFGLDTARTEAQAKFWAAVLGGKIVEDEVAGSTFAPTIWFQPADTAGTSTGETDRVQRWHPDIWVPHDEPEARIKRVLDAGGALVDDSHAPEWWVMADPDGNRFCICTSLPR